MARVVVDTELLPADRSPALEAADRSCELAFQALVAGELQDADQQVERCLAASADDPVYRMLRSRISELLRNGYPPDRDGVVNRRTK